MSPPLIDIASVQRWRKLFIAAGLFARSAFALRVWYCSRSASIE